eukprot:GHUV01044066.1.p1 GENE.GHUV01044066.1~~GHUV01044066.1.p1  ORF type:complete len:100 (-),score=1.70 GHUV01044066.1:319-618(-)
MRSVPSVWARTACFLQLVSALVCNSFPGIKLTSCNTSRLNKNSSEQQHNKGNLILHLNVVLQDAAVSHCWDLPPTTFGGAYAEFMGTRGFRADDRPVTR